LADNLPFRFAGKTVCAPAGQGACAVRRQIGRQLPTLPHVARVIFMMPALRNGFLPLTDAEAFLLHGVAALTVLSSMRRDHAGYCPFFGNAFGCKQLLNNVPLEIIF
jgi:hypothetical protein